MSGVGKHSGDPVEETPVVVPRNRLLGLAAGVTGTLIAWGFLVWQAIEFGGKARDGQGLAWFFLFVATLGATACLFATLILTTKLIATLRGDVPPPKSAGPPGGRRAAR